MFCTSLYYFDDEMFMTIFVLIINCFKDKLRVTAVGKHKLRPYSLSIHWKIKFSQTNLF